MKTIHEKLGRSSPKAGRVLIDAHHHLWNLDTHRYPWLQESDEFFLGDHSDLKRNYLPEDYLKDSENQRVIATVHCEAEHDFNNEVEETRWIHEHAKHYGFPNAVLAHVWFHLDTCEERLLEHLHYPLVRGVRSKPITSTREADKLSVKGKSGSMQDARWLKGFSLLEKHGLTWDLRVPYWHLDEAAEVARAFPHTKIVINHTGFPWDRSEKGLESWRKGMLTLAACPNVSVKISELGLLDQPWTIEINRGVVQETLAMFGIERCMFASNYPVSRLRIAYNDQVNALVELLADYDEKQKDDFFWRNAYTFYRITL